MTTSHDTAPVRRGRWTARPLWQVGLAATMVAAVASVIVYEVARAAGVPMELTETFQSDFARMPVADMVAAVLVDGGLPGIVLAVVCRRWTRRPRLYFLALTAVGFIASFALPITSDGSTATKVVLSISHVIVAMIIVPALTLALPRGAGRISGQD